MIVTAADVTCFFLCSLAVIFETLNERDEKYASLISLASQHHCHSADHLHLLQLTKGTGAIPFAQLQWKAPASYEELKLLQLEPPVEFKDWKPSSMSDQHSFLFRHCAALSVGGNYTNDSTLQQPLRFGANELVHTCSANVINALRPDVLLYDYRPGHRSPTRVVMAMALTLEQNLDNDHKQLLQAARHGEEILNATPQRLHAITIVTNLVSIVVVTVTRTHHHSNNSNNSSLDPFSFQYSNSMSLWDDGWCLLVSCLQHATHTELGYQPLCPIKHPHHNTELTVFSLLGTGSTASVYDVAASDAVTHYAAKLYHLTHTAAATAAAEKETLTRLHTDANTGVYTHRTSLQQCVTDVPVAPLQPPGVATRSSVVTKVAAEAAASTAAAAAPLTVTSHPYLLTTPVGTIITSPPTVEEVRGGRDCLLQLFDAQFVHRDIRSVHMLWEESSTSKKRSRSSSSSGGAINSNNSNNSTSSSSSSASIRRRVVLVDFGHAVPFGNAAVPFSGSSHYASSSLLQQVVPLPGTAAAAADDWLPHVPSCFDDLESWVKMMMCKLNKQWHTELCQIESGKLAEIKIWWERKEKLNATNTVMAPLLAARRAPRQHDRYKESVKEVVKMVEAQLVL